jgi:hypothetical protein
MEWTPIHSLAIDTCAGTVTDAHAGGHSTPAACRLRTDPLATPGMASAITDTFHAGGMEAHRTGGRDRADWRATVQVACAHVRMERPRVVIPSPAFSIERRP